MIHNWWMVAAGALYVASGVNFFTQHNPKMAIITLAYAFVNVIMATF